MTLLGAVFLLTLAPRPAFAGFLAVGNYSYGGVVAFDAASGANLGNFANPAVVGSPTGIIFSPDGNLYVSDFGGSAVRRFNGVTGAYMGDFVSAQSGGLVRPEGLTFGPDGNLYVANFGFGPAVLRYNGATGAFMDAFVPENSAGLTRPYSIAFGPDGNLYVSDAEGGNPYVRRFNGSTGAFMGNFTSAGFLSGGTDAIVFGPDGNLYETDEIGSQVLRFNGTTGAFMGVFASGGGLSHPSGLAFGPDGNLYVASGGGLFNTHPSGAILRYDGQTGAFIDTFASDSQLDGMYSLAFSPEVAPVPAPSSAALVVVAGMCLLAYAVWRRKAGLAAPQTTGSGLAGTPGRVCTVGGAHANEGVAGTCGGRGQERMPSGGSPRGRFRRGS